MAPKTKRDQCIAIDDHCSVPPPLTTPQAIAAFVAGPMVAPDLESVLQRRRKAVGTVVGLLAVGACCVLAGQVASSIAEPEEPAAVATVDAAAWRRLEEEQQQPPPDSAEQLPEKPEGCRKVDIGEACYRHVMWAMSHGLKQYGPRAYPGIKETSSFEEFQAVLHKDPASACPRPCGVTLDAEDESELQEDPASAPKAAPATEVDNTTISALSGSAVGLGWQPSGRVVAQGQWCSAAEPAHPWRLDSCGNGQGMQVKVLTYNLYWWNLFGRRGGNGGSAGHLIQRNGNPRYDVMAFQECEGIRWVLSDAGLLGEYEMLTGPHALCIAYQKSDWRLLSQSAANVAEDRGDQWYGTRAGMWVRLQHYRTGQVLFFVNHHGPLPLNSGGRCGGEATAFNLLRLIASEARDGDVIALVGDFNAGPNSQTLQSLRSHMHPVYTGSSFGGVDHVLSSCPRVAGTRNLGSGGSDHDALEAVIQL
mmetsp:Transcript_39546/g.113858  ORF Transcript_39546/g.113858 Transcript_39546/m.113858 type:complete len:477 (-) Transcript_39546:143-1573(-)